MLLANYDCQHYWKNIDKFGVISRVSVQGVKSLGGHFACLCWEFDFYELNFFKKKREMLLHF